ncbi:hypothetical protein JTE90_026809 [Oedothorax gibbosus]|nr:hypothetical protein JTE90_026809 [Oedothorax gibbosus]
MCTNSVNYTHCFVKCSPACHDRTFQFTFKEEDIITKLMDSSVGKKNWNRTVLLWFLFKRTQVNIYRYRAKYEGIELFSFLGGFIGIWLGVSLIALLDFLESLATFTVFLFDRVKANPRIASIGSAIGSRMGRASRKNSLSSTSSIPWAKESDRNHLRVEDGFGRGPSDGFHF